MTSKWADLKTRTLSAVVMVSGLIAILESGRQPFMLLLIIAFIWMLTEWGRLVRKIPYTTLWLVVGIIYISIACVGLVGARFMMFDYDTPAAIYALIFFVAAVDISAYAFGKIFGKRKLWPSISPGKTWEGFIGSLAISILAAHAIRIFYNADITFEGAFIVGPAFATICLLGDLFESYLKRRAGVKDSGTLIPGHGGLLDRVDALLACSFILGLPIVIGMANEILY